MDKDDIIEIGELYSLDPTSDYWVVNAQRNMRFCDGNPIIVKVEHTHMDKIFFGHIQDGGGEIELEFGKEQILGKFDKEKNEKEEIRQIINRYALHYPIQGLLHPFKGMEND